MAKSRASLALQSGFTLAEMVIVVTIILAVGGMSIPSLTRAIDASRIKRSTQALAAVYQDARIRAAQKDTSYTVLVSPLGVTPAQVCIDLDGDGVCGVGDPVTTFPGRVSISNPGVPVKLGAQLTYFATDTEHSTAPGNGLMWNAVGVPCQRTPGGAQCIATGWVQYLQLQRANGEVLYAAVTVSPTGRVKTWTFIPSGNGNGKWL